MKNLFASVAFALAIATLAPAHARAETPAAQVTAKADEPTRKTRPVLLSAVAKASLPMPGLDIAYQLTDRFALGAQVATLLVWGDLSAYARYFVLAYPRSGLFVDVAGHYFYSILHGATYTPSLEIGYEGRSASGATASFSAGLMRIHDHGCDHCGDANRAPSWATVPVLSLRLGYAF